MADGDAFTLYDGSEFTVLERPRGPEDALVMRFRLKDGCPAPPPHVHPHTIEIFEVTAGSFELLVDDEWRRLSAGQSLTLPPGTRHTFRNHSGADVVIRNVHEPHHDFEAYLRALARLTHEAKATSPRSPAAAAHLALIWERHSDLIEPADLPLKVALPVLSFTARLLRMRPPEPA